MPDERSYIVRDIKAFLTVVKNEGYYQIGKNYFEPLSLIQFDEPSQELIQFLWRILPDGDHLDIDYIAQYLEYHSDINQDIDSFHEQQNMFFEYLTLV